MRSLVRLAAAAAAAFAAFFVGVLGIEYAAWFHAAPVDPFADPAINAIRFAVSAAIGLAAGVAAYPRSGRSAP